MSRAGRHTPQVYSPTSPGCRSPTIHYRWDRSGCSPIGTSPASRSENFTAAAEVMPTRTQPLKPDRCGSQLRAVLSAIGLRMTRINLAAHRPHHWEHSFDTATWSRLTGCAVIGSQTTCFEVMRRTCRPNAAAGLRFGKNKHRRRA